jgi:hypothetical protein
MELPFSSVSPTMSKEDREMYATLQGKRPGLVNSLMDSRLIRFDALRVRGESDPKFSNFWSTCAAPLRSEVVAEIPFAPYKDLLEVVIDDDNDEWRFFLGSRKPGRRHVTLIGRHSESGGTEEEVSVEMHRRLAIFGEFEVAINCAAPARIGPVRSCGRNFEKNPQINWPFNHSCGQINYGHYLMSQMYALPATSGIIRAATRGYNSSSNVPFDIHNLTPGIQRNWEMSKWSCPVPEQVLVPDDIFMRIFGHFVNSTTPLAGPMASEIKLVCRQWYRCWWKAALGSSSPTKLWFGDRANAYFGSTLYRPCAKTKGVDDGCHSARLLDLLCTPFNLRSSLARQLPAAAAAPHSIGKKIMNMLTKTKVDAAAAAGSSNSNSNSNPFSYTVIDASLITSLDLSGQCAAKELCDVVKKHFPNLRHLIWNRSRMLDDQTLSGILSNLHHLKTLSVAFSATLWNVRYTARELQRLQIEELNVAGCSFGAQGLKELSNCCSASLRRLDISGLDYAVPAVTEGCDNQKMTHVPFLQSRSLYAYDYTFEMGGSDFPNLEVLLAADLAMNFNGYDLLPFHFGEQAAKNLRALDMSTMTPLESPEQMLNMVGKLTSLEVLHLNGFWFTDKCADASKSIAALSRLRYLGVSSMAAGEYFANMLADLLASSPKAAPLTIMQMTYHTRLNRRPFDFVRHLVWPTALCFDDVARRNGSNDFSPGSHSLAVRSRSCMATISNFTEAQQVFAQTETMANMLDHMGTKKKLRDPLGGYYILRDAVYRDALLTRPNAKGFWPAI